MEWEKLARVQEAPEQGWMLAYFRKEILLDKYSSREDVRKHIENRELLELHLFDPHKEYRAISSQSRRYPAGVVEAIADFKLDQDATYVEECYLEAKFGKKIRICNHLNYDENGMLEIDNYRLVLEEV